MIWNREELEQAVVALTRACQARWGSIAIVLILWQWGLRNREDPFSSIVDKLWHPLVKTMANMELDISSEAVSAAALCKARQGVGTDAFEYLQQIATGKHREQHAELILYKGYRLYAVDGSDLPLCSNKALSTAFGRPSSTGKHKSPPQATFTVLEFVNTGWITDYRLSRWDTSELAQSKSLTATLGQGDLLLADRLYFDPLWYADLCRRKVKFLFRLNCNRHQSLTSESQQRIEEQRAKGNVDCTVDLRVRTSTGKGTYTLLRNLRYIEIKRPGAATLYFITNLDPDELPTLEAAELYRMRWEIETNLRYFKGQDHLPVVRSRRKDTVQQEVMLHVLAHNSVRFIQSEACLAREPKQAEQTTDTTEYDNQHDQGIAPQPAEKWTAKANLHSGPLRPIDIQFRRTVDVVLGAILAVLLEPERAAPEYWQRLLTKIAAFRIMAKPGRSYPRRGRKYNKGKRNKGNTRAQKRRAAARREGNKTGKQKPKGES